MKLGDVAGHSLANLRRHKLRTALTVCGVVVGVSTLTVMVSLATGLDQIVTQQFDQAELVNRVTVFPRGTKQQMFGMELGEEAEDVAAAPLTEEVLAEFRKLPGVVAVYADVHTAMAGEIDGKRVSAETEGLPAEALTGTYQTALLAGEYWKGDDPGPVAVAPSRLLKQLGFSRPEEMVGKTVTLRSLFSAGGANPFGPGRRPGSSGSGGAGTPGAGPQGAGGPEQAEGWDYRIIGVYRSEDFGVAGKSFHVPLTEGKLLLERSGLKAMLGHQEGSYRAVTVKVGSSAAVDSVGKEIEGRGFDVFTIFDLLKPLRIVILVFGMMLSFFGGIGLVVAFFGIANTMLMAVLERTREIGILMALGARRRDVRRVFLLEAASIGALGGMLGVGIGWSVGAILNFIARRVSESETSVQLFYVPGWLALVGIALAAFVAGIAGLYPAWRAARLDPVEALRRD